MKRVFDIANRCQYFLEKRFARIQDAFLFVGFIFDGVPFSSLLR